MPNDVQEMTLEEYNAALAGQQAKKTPTPIQPRTLPNGRVIDTQEDWEKIPARIRAKSKMINPRPKRDIENELSQFWTDINDRSGTKYGMTPENRRWLGSSEGDSNSPIPRVLQPIGNLPANIADLGVRTLQLAEEGAAAAANHVDNVMDETGLADLPANLGLDPNPGVHTPFHPGEALMALQEAFPLFGMESGHMPATEAGHFSSPTKDPLAPEVRVALNKQADELFEGGASADELQAWAKDSGLGPLDPEALTKAVGARDVSKVTASKTPPEVVTTGSPANDVSTYPAPASGLTPELRTNPTKDVLDEQGFTGHLNNLENLLDGLPEGHPDIPVLEKKIAEAYRLIQEKRDKSGSIPRNDNEPQTARSISDSETPVVDTPDVVTRLTEALTNAGKASEEQKALLHKSRSEKFSNVAETAQKTSGEAGLYSELSQLKGKTPKAEFEPPELKFTQEEKDSLFDSIKHHPDLSPVETIRGRIALADLLGGELPKPAELHILGKVFPPDFVKAALSNRSSIKKLLDTGIDVLSIPRSLMSSFDFSAPFRQGINFVGRPEFWKNYGPMFKYAWDEKHLNVAMESVRAKKHYNLMKDYGLAVELPGEGFVGREEQFMSHLAERLPIVGRVVRASERGYQGFLIRLRADVTENIIDEADAAGLKFSESPEKLRSLMEFVNTSTGRGNLPKSIEGIAPLLNATFFSPKLISSRFNVLANPFYYARMDPFIRKQALRDMLKLGALATSVIGIAKLGGADVEADPRSSDFAKIRTGNVRRDILGGYAQPIVLGARLRASSSKSLKGNVKEFNTGPFSSSDSSTILHFLRTKLSPVASLAVDYREGENVVGEPFTWKSAIGTRVFPMFLQDLKDVVEEEGASPKGVIDSVAAGSGVSVQVFDPNKRAGDTSSAVPEMSLEEYNAAIAEKKKNGQQ